MSLYELELLMRTMAASDKPARKEVSDEEWERAQEMLAAVTVNDPNVRMH
ncbi:hypothetical protein [Pelagibacterium sp. H642]|nr:hypothetical protein [Pelagibacterium sp. H642]WMT90157.1 hypothetical protein NO934_15365 [Pelagibacterium sp. H642]